MCDFLNMALEKDYAGDDAGRLWFQDIGGA